MGSILVARFLGSTSYGALTIASIPISIATLFGDLGISSGLVKYIAQFRKEERSGDIKVLVRTGLLINTAVSLLLFSIIFLTSGILASTIFHQPEIQILIQVSSFNLIAQSLIKTTRSIFIGFEKMEFVSSTVIVNSILRSVLSPLLVYIGLGSFGAVVGYTTTFIVTGVLGVIIVLFVLYKPLMAGESSINYRDGFELLLLFGYPIFLSTIVSGALSQVYRFLMAVHVDPFNIGNYKAATNFTTIVTFFSLPIGTVLFPLFSKLDYREDKMLASVFQNSVKYSALIIVPVTTVLMLVSEPLVRIVYGASYPMTAFFMKLLLIDYLFVGLGKLNVRTLLTGQGKTKFTFLTHVLSFSLGVPLSLYLIPRFGIVGLLMTLIIVPRAGLFCGLWWIKRTFGFTFSMKTSAKIYLSSAISYLTTYYLLDIINLGDWQELFLGGGSFVLVYLFAIYAFHTIDLDDIQNLRRILGAMGPLTPIFNIFLTLFEKILKK